MRLRDLLGEAAPRDLEDVEIAGLSADSRAIGSDYVFFAIAGHAGDGLDYVEDAKARGAKIVVAERLTASDIPCVIVDDVRATLAKAAARFYRRQPDVIAAVTGTSGKTSVVAFLRQLWAELGRQAASIGTIGIVDPSGARYGSLTTPGPVDLHRALDRLAQEGVTHLAMEASSIGIDQRRLDGVRLSAAAFTNFSRDHLDLHKNLEEYFAAKMRLFDTLLHADQTAVIDADSDVADRVVATCRARGLRLFEVGAKGRDIMLLSSTPEASGTCLRLRHDGADYDVALPLIGAFQTSNALVAAGLAIATGEDAGRVFGALEKLKGAPGRLELVGSRLGAPVLVDYAHKPDALEKLLAALRPLTRRKLIVVFGCGGDRDAGKRPMMGEIAARSADIVIVTDDNPRSEEAAKIRAAVLQGARDARSPAEIREIGDRQAAITEAIRLVDQGDVLVVAGKGHETGQIVGDRVLPFSDHEVIAAALQELER
jgi:UDP-N-acetylmuramoyl-L-alanyl-D-glutamate--2,6-diaminopimelate ligase